MVRFDTRVRIIARAAQRVGGPGGLCLVLVDIQVGESVATRIRSETGVELREATIVALDGESNESAVPIETTSVDTIPVAPPEPLTTVYGLSGFRFWSTPIGKPVSGSLSPWRSGCLQQRSTSACSVHKHE